MKNILDIHKKIVSLTLLKETQKRINQEITLIEKNITSICQSKNKILLMKNLNYINNK